MPTSKDRSDCQSKPRKSPRPLSALDGSRVQLNCCCRPTLVLSITRLRIERSRDCPSRTDPASAAGNLAREACGRAAVVELERRGIAAVSVCGTAPGQWTIAGPKDMAWDPVDAWSVELRHL